MADRDNMRIWGLILAGGAGRRLGGRDKAMVMLGGRPLVGHVIDRFAPQVARLALSANGDPVRFAGTGLPVLPDHGEAGLGPMAGLAAGLAWLEQTGGTHLATVSVDVPFLPADLVPRLADRAGADGLAVAAFAGRRHPTCGLWPLRLRAAVDRALEAGERRIGLWSAAEGAVAADFGQAGADPFWNINTPDDLAEAERRLT